MNMYKEIVERLAETSSVALCRKWRGLEGELAQMERKLIGGADVAAAGAEAVGAGAISQGLPVCVRAVSYTHLNIKENPVQVGSVSFYVSLDDPTAERPF